MEDVVQSVGRTSFKSYFSKKFSSKEPKASLDATDAKTSSFVKRSKPAPNTLNVSYLHNAPHQLALNQRWYKDDLSRAKDKTVRLLYLDPGQKQDLIAGKLVCVPVGQKPRYDALSYSWGDQTEWTEITLDGLPGFAVTQTLWAILRRLRSTAVARPIWIDAICINQNNVDERGQQVNMMDSTFGNARSVLIWLGDCEDGEFVDRDEHHLARQILSKVEADMHDETKAWFNRLWVVQEVALAKELMVYFGPYVLTWADFFGSAESRAVFRGVVHLRTARALIQSHGFARKDEVSLEELLALTGNCYASDPLDYIFGIIGLVPTQQLNGSNGHNHLLRVHGLSPDYTLTPYELLTRLNDYLASTGRVLPGTTMISKMLSWSVSIGHLQLARLLLDSDQVDLATEGPLALREAAEFGQVATLQMLIDDYHFSPNMRDSGGRTLLSWAAAQAETEAVRSLIDDYDLDPDMRDNGGRTPLSWAAASKVFRDPVASNKPLETVELLLGMSQVDADSEDSRGRTPIAWAVYAGNLFVVHRLLDSGRTNPSRRFDGHSLINWAIALGHYSIADLLIEKGVSDGEIKNVRNWEQFLESGVKGRIKAEYWLDDGLVQRKLPSLFRIKSRN